MKCYYCDKQIDLSKSTEVAYLEVDLPSCPPIYECKNEYFLCCGCSKHVDIMKYWAVNELPQFEIDEQTNHRTHSTWIIETAEDDKFEKADLWSY